MSSVPVVVAPAPDLASQLAQHVADLGHKHASVSYLLIGILALFLIVCSVGGYIALKSFDNQLAKQDVKDAQYQADRKTFMDSLAAHDAERAAQAQQITDLEAQIKQRAAKPLPPAVQTSLKPGADAQTVATGLTEAYKHTTSFGAVAVIPPETIALSPPQAQQVIQAKADLDALVLDLGDERSINSILNASNSSLTNDLGSCKALNVQANKDIAGYKKLATKSKFRKFLDGALKVGLFAGGVYAGHKI